MVNLCTRFEFSNFVHYKDMNGDTVWKMGWLWVTEGHWQCHHSIERTVHTTSYSALIKPVWWPRLNIIKIFGVRIPRLLCGIVSVILHLAILVDL